MGLPAQIQKQLDEADATIARLAQPQAEGNTVAPAAGSQQEPATPATPAPEITPTPSDESREEFQRLEQRYKSLQGMWQSAEARLRQSQAQVAELTQRLEELAAKVETPAQAPAEPRSSLVTDKDAEAFGTDLIDLARRISREEFGAREEQLLGQIQKLETQLAAATQQVGSVVDRQVRSARDTFFATLDSALPDWEALQASPEGQSWLTSRVPGTTLTWNDTLQDAARSFDSERALEVFTTFLAAHPKLDKRQRPQPQPNQNRADLARQVAPARAAAASSAPEGRKVYTAREYSAAMDKVIQLNKARRYDDAQALENELGAALAEGRVSP